MPIPGFRVYCNAPLPQKFVGFAVTDRLGLFRLKGLPKGQFRLSMDKDGYGSGSAMIPDEAWEVDLTLPGRPDAPE